MKLKRKILVQLKIQLKRNFTLKKQKKFTLLPLSMEETKTSNHFIVQKMMQYYKQIGIKYFMHIKSEVLTCLGYQTLHKIYEKRNWIIFIRYMAIILLMHRYYILIIIFIQKYYNYIRKRIIEMIRTQCFILYIDDVIRLPVIEGKKL